MPMDASDIETMIKAAIPDANVEIQDLAGDGDHFAATVTSAAFKGKIPRSAAPDGLCGAARPHGRRTARSCVDDGDTRHLSRSTRRLDRRGTGETHDRCPPGD